MSIMYILVDGHAYIHTGNEKKKKKYFSVRDASDLMVDLIE